MRSDAFRAAAESKDFDAGKDLFTDDVRFRSPVVYKPYEGREALQVILAAVLTVFEDFRYVEVGERSLQGVDILKFDDDGRIAELTVMVRPMSGMHAVAERMRELLEAAGNL